MLFSCEKNESPFNYGYKITYVTYYSPNYMSDSTIFYYDTEDRLIRTDDCKFGFTGNPNYPEYQTNYISLHGHKYFLNQDDNINSIVYSYGGESIYEYEHGRIVYESTAGSEQFFTYQDGVLLQDSIVHDNKYITVYNYSRTDILTPDFVVHYTGFKEFPKRSTYLIQEGIAEEHGIKVYHYYDVSEYKLIDTVKTIDTFYNDTFDIEIRKFYYEVN